MAHDWEAFKRAFVTDPKRPSLRAFAQAVKIKPSTVQYNATRGGWLEARETHWSKVEQKTAEHVVSYQVREIVLETSERLDEIRRMQKVALRAAGGGQHGELVSYEKPHEAVAAYEKLVKLERLLTDQSTENLNLSDGRQVVEQLFAIIREEVNDNATLERIAARLAELGGAAARVGPPAESLN